jgi:phage protein D
MPSDAIAVADLEVRVNGGALPPATRADIESVTVTQDVGALSMFTLALHNWDSDQLRVTWSDSNLFTIGAEVQVSLGVVGDLHPVMTGEITGLEPTFSSDSAPMLTVRGFDHRHRLARGRRTRTFVRLKDSAIASQIARGAGLRSDVTDTRITLEYVVQHNQSDLEFLQRRAKLIGYEVYVRDKVLHFRPPRASPRPVATLEIGREITDFSARLRSLNQVGEVSVRGWNVKQKATIVGSAKETRDRDMMGGTNFGHRQAARAFGRAGDLGVTTPVSSKARADQIATGRFDEMASEFVEAEVACDGSPRLAAGSVVDIQGAGQRFSGHYYITSLTHTLSPIGGLRTELTVQRNAS